MILAQVQNVQAVQAVGLIGGRVSNPPLRFRINVLNDWNHLNDWNPDFIV